MLLWRHMLCQFEFECGAISSIVPWQSPSGVSQLAVCLADEDGEQDAAGAEEEDEEMEEELDHLSEEDSARDLSPPSGSGGILPATGRLRRHCVPHC